MSFANNMFATIWNEIRRNTAEDGTVRSIDVSLSTSRARTADDGSRTYETDFSNIVRLVGNARDNYLANGVVANRESKTTVRMHVNRCFVTNNYDKEKNTTYYNFVVSDAEVVQRDASAPAPAPAPAAAPAPAPAAPANINIPKGLDDEPLPFS